MALGKDDIELQNILQRYFLKELDEEQVAEVNAWRAESDENAHTFDEARILHLDIRGLGYYERHQASADASWEQFKASKNLSPQPSRSILAYAASITVLIGAFIGIYFLSGDGEELSVLDTEQVDELSRTTLTDGTMITLNEGASIEIIDKAEERQVALRGEAYFEVARDKQKAFVVESSGAQIRVLGTKFFVNKPGSGLLEVKVSEGKVLVSFDEVHEVLRANETVLIDLQQGEVLGNQQQQSGLSTFWKTKRLSFQNTPLSEVAEILGKAYGLSVLIEGPQENCQLSVEFEDEDFANVIEIISNTLGLEVSSEESTTILKGNGCE